jgi:hypothetical protein
MYGIAVAGSADLDQDGLPEVLCSGALTASGRGVLDVLSGKELALLRRAGLFPASLTPERRTALARPIRFVQDMTNDGVREIAASGLLPDSLTILQGSTGSVVRHLAWPVGTSHVPSFAIVDDGDAQTIDWLVIGTPHILRPEHSGAVVLHYLEGDSSDVLFGDGEDRGYGARVIELPDVDGDGAIDYGIVSALMEGLSGRGSITVVSSRTKACLIKWYLRDYLTGAW